MSYPRHEIDHVGSADFARERAEAWRRGGYDKEAGYWQEVAADHERQAAELRQQGTAIGRRADLTETREQRMAREGMPLGPELEAYTRAEAAGIGADPDAMIREGQQLRYEGDAAREYGVELHPDAGPSIGMGELTGTDAMPWDGGPQLGYRDREAG